LSEERLQLEGGDRLVLLTDGLADTLGPDGEPFGNERLEYSLRHRAGSSPSELCDAIFAELAQYRGEADQYDDMAMLVVRVE
jgi:sigma-B regulation protein RsbU (phosphoserine phosphatase)